VPRTALVGRDNELRDALQRLEDVRLLTCTGIGGAGKTRLAVAVAEAATASMRDGVVWVDLSALASGDLVVDAVAAAVGVSRTSDQGVTQALAERLSGSELLLALDNCEHVLASTAGLVDFLLDHCPRLRIVATSREPLGVEGEQVWPISPLAPPAVGGDDLLAAVLDSPACQLFEQRARAVLPDFRLSTANAVAVSRLCRRLEGLPLALELAAARMRVLSVEQIDAGLTDVLHLLVGGTRTAPARQQTLRATLDWSFDLLSEAERVFFSRLGVFPGAFDLAAAASVAARPPIDAADAVDVLTRLVERSLVEVRRGAAGVRYRLLAPVRPYAKERLRQRGEFAATSEAHLKFYADLTCDAEPRLIGPTQARELDRLEMEGNNLRVALAYGRDHERYDDGVRLAASLWRLCYLRGHYQEGRVWLDWAATASPDTPPALRAKALLGGGVLAFLECDYAAAVRRLEASLRLHRQLDDGPGCALALQSLGSVAREQGRYVRAADLHAQSLSLFLAAADPLGAARAHAYLGFNAWLQGQWETARQECGRAIEDFRSLEDDEGMAWCLISLGTVAQYEGRLQESAALLAEAHRLSEKANYPEGLAWSLHEAGLLALRRGAPDAYVPLRASLAQHRELGDRWRVSSVLDDLAWCSAVHGRAELAAALLGAAAGVRLQIGTELAPCERPDHERTEEKLRSWLGDEGFMAAYEGGRVGSLDDVLAALPEQGAVIEHRQPVAEKREPVEPAVIVPQDDRLVVRMLGQSTVRLGDRLLEAADWGYGKPRELLFLLVSSPPLSKEQIGAALWPMLSERQLRNAFHTALRDLRRALEVPEWVVYSGGRYAVNRERAHDFDVESFEQNLNEARRATPPPAALPYLQAAVAAYRGDFLADMPGAEWAVERREQLRRGFGAALLGAARRLIAEERFREALEMLRRAVRHEPLDESAHRLLMQCLMRVGEAGQAATVYTQLEQRLREEVGVGPSAETTALYKRLSRPVG
jgi:predicted ATPase/DNA-binding SARP family transcriptional activator